MRYVLGRVVVSVVPFVVVLNGAAGVALGHHSQGVQWMCFGLAMTGAVVFAARGDLRYERQILDAYEDELAERVAAASESESGRSTSG